MPSKNFLKLTLCLCLIFITFPYSFALTLQTNPFNYSSAYRDSESALHYLNARYYHPETGRFTSRDNYQLLNRYAYAEGNPIMKEDPSGHSAAGLIALNAVAMLSSVGHIVAEGAAATTLEKVSSAQMFGIAGSVALLAATALDTYRVASGHEDNPILTHAEDAFMYSTVVLNAANALAYRGQINQELAGAEAKVSREPQLRRQLNDIKANNDRVYPRYIHQTLTFFAGALLTIGIVGNANNHYFPVVTGILLAANIAGAWMAIDASSYGSELETFNKPRVQQYAPVIQGGPPSLGDLQRASISMGRDPFAE